MSYVMQRGTLADPQARRSDQAALLLMPLKRTRRPLRPPSLDHWQSRVDEKGAEDVTANMAGLYIVMIR